MLRSFAPWVTRRWSRDLLSGANRFTVKVQVARLLSPTLSSRIRAPKETVANWDQIQQLTGLMRATAWNAADCAAWAPLDNTLAAWLDLSGQVLSVSPNGRFLALADNTGVALLELSPPGKTVAAGQKITLEGNCVVEGARRDILHTTGGGQQRHPRHERNHRSNLPGSRSAHVAPGLVQPRVSLRPGGLL